MRYKKWARLLAYVTGSVNRELFLQNEYLAAENRILRAQFPTKLRLSNPERATLAEIGSDWGSRWWQRSPVSPNRRRSLLGKLVANKFDGSKHRQISSRPAVPPEVEALVVMMAGENTGWGYDRIVGALANLGYHLSDQTVRNILRRYGIAPALKRSRTTSWKDFISVHKDLLAGAIDAGGWRVKTIQLPARSPKRTAFSRGWRQTEKALPPSSVPPRRNAQVLWTRRMNNLTFRDRACIPFSLWQPKCDIRAARRTLGVSSH
jgi:hypothetical protein